MSGMNSSYVYQLKKSFTRVIGHLVAQEIAMGRKRLQHAADTFCHMFQGWRLTNSYKQIVGAGSGTLVLNALTGACRFNGEAIAPMNIAQEIECWFKEDLENNNIELSTINHASLTANIILNEVPASKQKSGNFYIGKDGKPIEKGILYRLHCECNSEISVEERNYVSESSFVEKWPVGWPDI